MDDYNLDFKRRLIREARSRIDEVTRQTAATVKDDSKWSDATDYLYRWQVREHTRTLRSLSHQIKELSS